MKLLFLFALCFFGWLSAGGLQAEEVKAIVVSVKGTAEFAPPDSIYYKALQKGQILELGCKVRTGDDGEVVLSMTPGSAIQVGHDSLLKIKDMAFEKAGGIVSVRKALLELNAGEVSALIDPSTPKVTDFQIQTPQGAVAARGTYYSVMVIHNKTYIRVNEGKTSGIAKPSKGSL